MNPLAQIIAIKQQALNGYRARMDQLKNEYAMLEKLCEVEEDAIATLGEQVPEEAQEQGVVTQSPITPQAAQQMPLRRPKVSNDGHVAGCMCDACVFHRTSLPRRPPMTPAAQQVATEPPAGQDPPQYGYVSMQPFAGPPVHGNIYDAGVVIPDGGLHGRVNTTGVSQGAKAMEEI